MGSFDFIKDVIEKEGELNFWRINMRPGKPLTFGHYQNIPFIGLAGNPVSAFVEFMVFVRPVVEKMLGDSQQAKVTERGSQSRSNLTGEKVISVLIFIVKKANAMPN